MKSKKLFIALLLFSTTVYVTRVFQVPIIKGASPGYFNLGDMVVIFAGLYLGPLYGFLVGGLGSAMADLMCPYWYFFPLTFVAKGLEGLVVGFLKRWDRTVLLGALLGAASMIATYYLGERYLMNSQGKAAANIELPFNIAQGVIGVGVGLFAYHLLDYLFSNEVENLEAGATASEIVGGENLSRIMCYFIPPVTGLASSWLNPDGIFKPLMQKCNLQLYLLRDKVLQIYLSGILKTVGFAVGYLIVLIALYLMLLKLISLIRVSIGNVAVRRLFDVSTIIVSIMYVTFFTQFFVGFQVYLLQTVDLSSVNFESFQFIL